MKKILIVDDDPVNIMIFAEALESEGYKVLAATSGEEAIECASREENKPDFVLLDIIMPGIDGYEVCKMMKSNEKTRDITVMFMTGIEMRSLEYIKSIGAVDCLVKPFDFDLLAKKVKKYLETETAK